MTVPRAPSGPSARVDDPVSRIRLDAGGIPLSALVGRPSGVTPRAVVVALHGAGLSAAYFHGQARSDLSLIGLGMRLGFTVVALDRPGYGASAPVLPRGGTAAEQADLVREALTTFAARHPVGAGFFLLAHSFGGKVALTTAAGAPDPGVETLGLDISGCGHRYPDPVDHAAKSDVRMRNWGPLRCYPPGTFRRGSAIVAPVPQREADDARCWPAAFPAIAARVRIPVRFTFAEYESWWRHDELAVTELSRRFTAAPRVVVDRQPDSGHNISLGFSARAYHLKAFGFFEECLVALSAADHKRAIGPHRNPRENRP